MKYSPGFLLLLGSWLQSTHVLPWVSWHSEVMAFLALGWFVGVALLEKIRAREAELAIPRIVWMPMALGLYALGQFAWGQIEFFGDALMIMIYMAAATMALTVGSAWGTNSRIPQHGSAVPAQLSQLAVTLLVGALLSAVIMLVQAFDVWTAADWIVRTDGFRRPGGNLGQTNHMGTLLLMGLTSLVLLYQTKQLGALLAGMMQLLLILALAMTESRTGLLSAGVVTAWWFAHRGLFTKGRPGRQLAYAWLVLLFLVWAWPLFIQTWHFAEGLRRMNADAGMRLIVWTQLLDAVMQRPWAGWGLREVSEAHNAVLHQYATSGPFSYAHNVLLDLMVGLGIPLALLLVGLCVRWAWNRMRATSTLAGWYCLAIAIPLGVHSMLEFPYAYFYFLLPVLLAIGMMESRAERLPGPRVRTAYAAAGASVVFLAMAWSAMEYVVVEEDFRVARFEALKIGQTPSEYTRPNILILTQLNAMLKATRIQPAPRMPESELELLRQAAMRFPWTAIQNRYALSLALNGNLEETRRQLQVMRAMHGEKHYASIKAAWEQQAQEKYPQLKEIKLP